MGNTSWQGPRNEKNNLIIIDYYVQRIWIILFLKEKGFFFQAWEHPITIFHMVHDSLKRVKLCPTKEMCYTPDSCASEKDLILK